MKTRKGIVIVGSPGSGKGTQAGIIARRLSVPHISTGIILRNQIAKNTPFGRRIRKILGSGRLVHDSLVNTIIQKRLTRRDCVRGVVLDGYPRTLQQARYLERFLTPDLVIALDIPDQEIIRRMSGRRIGPDGTVYHLQYNPPPKSLLGKLSIRDDERPQTVRRRLRVYHAQTAPLLQYYDKRKKLVRVDARPSIAQIAKTIRTILCASKPIRT